MLPKKRVLEIVRRLEEEYPLAECTLDFKKDYELLFSVRLAAQCTDARVNMITPALFERFPTLQSFADAEPEDVEPYVRSCGFYRAKARDIVASARMLVDNYGGRVPDTMEELLKLPGVGRKTANIVMNNVFGVVEGIAVDTHVNRIAHKLGLVVPKRETDPNKVEAQLLGLIPRELWGPVNHQWVLFGREYCDAKRPRCGECPLADICPSAGK